MFSSWAAAPIIGSVTERASGEMFVAKLSGLRINRIKVRTTWREVFCSNKLWQVGARET